MEIQSTSHRKSFFSLKSGAKSAVSDMPYLIKRFSLKEKIAFWMLFWLFIAGLLGILKEVHSKFSVEVPRVGGNLTEGVVGRPAFINPVLATSDTDTDLSLLVYSGLLRATPEGGFIPDLADTYTISEDGLSYTVTLKEGLSWHDGEQVTTDDVIFTINKIKDPLTKSPKRASWEGVGATKLDDRTVIFSLGQPYALFLENLTTGIIPEHIWRVSTTEDFINNAFNTNPIGSGPYEIEEIRRDKIGIAEYYDFKSFDKFALGKPPIKELRIRFYSNEDALFSAFTNGRIESLGGGSPAWVNEQKKKGKNVLEFPLTRVFGVFLNQNQAQIFTHAEVRMALNYSADRERILEEVLLGFGTPITGPLPPGSLGFVEPTQENMGKEQAKEILIDNGWKLNENGIFQKKVGSEEERLIFSLSTANVPELKRAAELLKANWQEVGIRAEIKVFEEGDLRQEVIRPRNYSALLFGEVTGRDPDPFAFWHSSQRLDPGLNIALYTNVTADKLLEEARKLEERKEREKKYKEFQMEVLNDMPVVFIYSPSYLYITPTKIKNIVPSPLTVSSERFINIHEWFIDTDTIWKIFSK